MDDLKDFCCLNPACTAYGQRGGANLRVAFRYGPGKQRRLLACRTCQKRFSERAGTPLFDCRLPEAKAVDVLAHLQEGVGVRKTSRLVGVNKNTVVRLALQAGRHAPHSHDELVAFSPSDA
jgi:transposase-like protein